jgi:hypothetical protein
LKKAQTGWANGTNKFEGQVRETLGTALGGSPKPVNFGGRRPDVVGTFKAPLQGGGGAATLKGITEVKSGIKITNRTTYGDKQLQLFFEAAVEQKVPFNLVISPNTKSISSDVADFVRRTGGQVLEFDPTTKTFTKINIGGEVNEGLPWKRSNP